MNKLTMHLKRIFLDTSNTIKLPKTWWHILEIFLDLPILNFILMFWKEIFETTKSILVRCKILVGHEVNSAILSILIRLFYIVPIKLYQLIIDIMKEAKYVVQSKHRNNRVQHLITPRITCYNLQCLFINSLLSVVLRENCLYLRAGIKKTGKMLLIHQTHHCFFLNYS